MNTERIAEAIQRQVLTPGETIKDWIRRGPLRRLGFVPEVHQKLAEARRNWPDRTDSGRG
ncbi:hypothetical protein AB0L86_15335 [Micromonospora musae]|uniref:hypothetical protein n=1 Tax=Micromonospora musae TaxID=1894970 RepID=UPI00343D6CFE